MTWCPEHNCPGAVCFEYAHAGDFTTPPPVAAPGAGEEEGDEASDSDLVENALMAWHAMHEAERTQDDYGDETVAAWTARSALLARFSDLRRQLAEAQRRESRYAAQSDKMENAIRNLLYVIADLENQTSGRKNLPLEASAGHYLSKERLISLRDALPNYNRDSTAALAPTGRGG